MRNVRRRERGAAAVEFAIVLPILVAILCGTIDWGYYFYTREIVVNASREGARVGTLQFDSGVSSTGQAEDAARRYLTNTLGSAKAGSATIASAPCPAQSSCIQISYPIRGSVTGFLGSLVPQTIVAYAEMRK